MLAELPPVFTAPLTRSKIREIVVVDLFCGGGGTSQGLKEAIEDEAGFRMRLTGINHSERAIKTFEANHPEATAYKADLLTVNPLLFYKRSTIDILVGSPECQNHSIARGGMPINDQSRATAHCCTLWVEKLAPPVFIFENVREFREWGPLGSDGKPLKSRKGETFRAWLALLESFGYRVEHRLLRAADFGDPTTRMRLFVIGVRGRRAMPWPDQTHSKHPEMLGLKPWVPAREIIDWSIPGKSIFKRKKPLAEKTLRRIFIGLQKYSGLPFVLPNEGIHRGNRPRSTAEPLNTVTSRGAGSLVEPFLTIHRGESKTTNLNDPAPTVTAGGGHLGLAQPFLVQVAHGNGADPNGTADKRRVKSIEEPLPTVAGSRGDFYLAEPFIVPQQQGGSPVKSVDDPVPTITTTSRGIGLARPFVMPIDQQSGSGGTRTAEEPLTTITTKQRHALVEPYIVKFYGTADAKPISVPLDAVTTKERFGLAQPILEIDGKHYLLDINFRMLNWRELAAAQGFPRDYKFQGTSTQIVKMVGNAVPKNMAKALGRAAIKVL